VVLTLIAVINVQIIEFVISDLLVVTDPPFGGRYELVANTFERIKEDFFSTRNVTDVNVHLIWVFPYFFEHKVVSFFLINI